MRSLFFACLLLSSTTTNGVGETTEAPPEVSVVNNSNNDDDNNSGVADELRKLQEEMRHVQDQSRQANDIVLSMLTEFRSQFAILYTELRRTQGDVEQMQQEVNNVTESQQQAVENTATVIFTMSVQLEEVSICTLALKAVAILSLGMDFRILPGSLNLFHQHCQQEYPHSILSFYWP